MFHSLSSEFGIVKIAIPIGELLMESSRHGRLIVFFGEPRSPVEGRWSFRSGRIQCDLLLECFLGLIVASLPQGEPRGFPVNIGSASAIRKTLLRFAETVERQIVFVMNQVQISGGEQCLLQPGACGRSMAQLID